MRLVVGKRGTVPMSTELIIRFDYGSSVPWVRRTDDGDLLAISGPDMLVLRTPVELRGERLTTVGQFTVSAGQTIPFVLMHAQSHLPTPDPVDAQDALRQTQEFWEQWASTHKSTGMYADAVSRSLITLKALTYAPTGGIVAAPTTSLPEQIGGSRNWDYRFCWLRDATLTLLAFMNAGYYDEARYWRDWLLRAAAGSPSQIQTMYGLAGEKRLTEWEVPWLSGYEGSKPVRIGNAASDQLQIDVFGEVMDALHLARVGGLQDLAEGWDFQRALLSHLEKVWSSADDGIWEVRGERQHFTHSKVMAWVAFDRAIKSAEAFRLEGPIDHWRNLRAEIHDGGVRKGVQSRHRRLRPGIRIRPAGRKHSAYPRGRLLAAGRRARAGNDRGCRAPAHAQWVRAAVRYRGQAMTDSLGERVLSWHAASGWPTPTFFSVGVTTPASCSSGFFRCATISVCCRKSMTPPRSGCSAIFRRRSPISPWSTRRTTSRDRRSRASSVPGTCHSPKRRR